MAIIGLGQVDRNFIIIIIASICCLSNRLLNVYGETELFNNKIYTNIVIALAEILNVIPFILSRKRSKNKSIVNDLKNIDLNEEEKKFEYIYEELPDIKDEVKYKELYIILIGILFFLIILCLYIHLKLNPTFGLLIFYSLQYFIICFLRQNFSIIII